MMNEPSNNNQERRRDRLLIMAEILEVAIEGALKTQVMYRANLSFAQMSHYLSALLNLKLLELKKTSDRMVYKTTIKGVRFLESYKQMTDLLNKKENDCSNSGLLRNGKNHSVFILDRGNHVVCKEAP